MFMAVFTEQVPVNIGLVVFGYGLVCGSAVVTVLAGRSVGDNSLWIITLGEHLIRTLSMHPYMTLRGAVTGAAVGIASAALIIYCLIGFIGWQLIAPAVDPRTQMQLLDWFVGYVVPGCWFIIYVMRQIYRQSFDG
jgi:hypothetical protein